MVDDTSDPFSLARAAQYKAIRKRRRAIQQKRVQTARSAEILPQFSPTQRRGRLAEERAAEHLASAGLQVLERNLLCRAGEIDLVCRDDTVLVFVEVRERHGERFGGAAASVGRAKRQRLLRAAGYFLPRLAQRHFGGRTPNCRFDVVAIDDKRLSWLQGVIDAHP